MIQQLTEHQAIGQSGQRVVRCQMIEFLFNALAFGNITDDALESHRFA